MNDNTTESLGMRLANHALQTTDGPKGLVDRAYRIECGVTDGAPLPPRDAAPKSPGTDELAAALYTGPSSRILKALRWFGPISDEQWNWFLQLIGKDKEELLVTKDESKLDRITCFEGFQETQKWLGRNT